MGLSPITATYLGITGHDEALDDFSPAGHAQQSELRRTTLSLLEQATPVDDIDTVTIAAMVERLGLAEEEHAAGLDEMSLNVIASPLQAIRDVFDLMPTDSDEAWSTIATRMGAVPDALDRWVESLRSAATQGNVAARRQVEACVQQCIDLTADNGYFATLLANARSGDAELAPEVAARLATGVTGARDSYAALGATLATVVLH